jgi:glyoxylase-like metal-dependent hydrolase (beta-lactamase superfamily II)
MRLFPILALAAATAFQSALPAPRSIPPTVTNVADGLLLFETPPYGEVGMDGNAVAIVTGDGVVMFDSNGTPAASAAVLQELRKRTDKPVRYLVNSHWHWDHWYGAETYKKAFPDLRVITHEKTRRMMAGPAIEFNRPGLESQLPGYIKQLEKGLPKTQARLDTARWFLQQKIGTHHTLADVTFTNSLQLHLGGREIDVLNYGRAVTPGDAFIHLPRENIVLTGDLLVNPVSFALSAYPTEWLAVLEQIDALDASIIVPGHGAPLEDETLLQATIGVFRELLRQGKDAKRKGMDVDAARDAIFPSLRDLMVTITNDVPAINDAFRIQLVDWYLHRVYEELDGPLTDAIAKIPAT